MNHKKVERIWREEGLDLPQRHKKRRRVYRPYKEMVLQLRKNAPKWRVVPWFPVRAPDVVEVREKVCEAIGYPSTIPVDRGSEFISREPDLWAYMKGVTPAFSRQGKSDQ